MVNPYLTDFIDHHCDPSHLRMQQQFRDECGFPAAQKSSDQGHWDFSG
jgi:hypothetical protein